MKTRNTWILVLGVVAVMGCSPEKKVTYKNSPPVQVNYSVGFPSVSAAVDVTGVRVRAFALKSGEVFGACHELVQKAKSEQDLGTPAGETTMVSPCDLLQNPASGQLKVPFGEYAVLAIAFRGSDALLIGCTTTAVSDKGGKDANIAMSLFSNEVSINNSSCVDLSSHCKGGC